ncbi:MAG: SDR family NAD(P)-dependent oxidoreductase [Lachnospiraceae bacterium]|nr:SDR family NAD(P)-dependent oxidoreductase [Lachnospiraceae bacterium]
MKQHTALITGASRGIGAAIAEKFASEGWNLALTCIHSKEKLDALAERLHDFYGIACLTFAGDMGEEKAVQNCFMQITERFGGVNVLVNNAGISKVGLFTDLSLEDWELIMRTNSTSVFLCTRYAVPYMLKQKSGSIINISSVWGCVGASCETAYSASKGAVNALTMALAKELAPSHIAVNAIACGAIDTDMNACFTEEERAALAEEIPAGRFGQPEEAAELVFSLACRTSYLTGQIIRLDGGWI